MIMYNFSGKIIISVLVIYDHDDMAKLAMHEMIVWLVISWLGWG